MFLINRQDVWVVIDRKYTDRLKKPLSVATLKSAERNNPYLALYQISWLQFSKHFLCKIWCQNSKRTMEFNYSSENKFILCSNSIMSVLDFVTARKRSLRQGNMFTGVCLSRWGVPGPRGGAWSWWGACFAGVWSPGVWSRGVPAQGWVLVQGVVPGGDPPDGYCCGRYASYWNAFLFYLNSNLL